MADDAKLTFGGDARDLNRELKKTRREVDRLKDKLVKTQDQSKKTATSAKKGQSKWISNLKSVALGYMSIQTAAMAAGKALDYVRRQNQLALGEMAKNMSGKGLLAQLSGGDPKEYQRMLNESRKSIKHVGDMDTAMRLQFALESTGQTKDRVLYAKTQDMVGNVPDLVEKVAGVRDAFGVAETGTARQILSKGLEASKYTKTNLQKILQAALVPAQSAAKAGATDEETLAALSILSNVTKSPEVAGTQLSAIADVLIKKGMAGKGIMEGVSKIQGMGMSSQELQKFLGEKEAFRGFSVLAKSGKEINELIKNLNKVDKAALGKASLLDKTQAVFYQDKLVSAQRLRTASKGEEAYETEQLLGQSAAEREAVVSRIKVDSMRKKQWWGKKYYRGQLAETMSDMESSPEAIRRGDVLLEEALPDTGGEAGSRLIPVYGPIKSLVDLLSGIYTAVSSSDEELKKMNANKNNSTNPNKFDT